MINDMTSMKKTYLEIAKINADLFQEYKVRSTNHQELMAQLKTVPSLPILSTSTEQKTNKQTDSLNGEMNLKIYISGAFHSIRLDITILVCL